MRHLLVLVFVGIISLAGCVEPAVRQSSSVMFVYGLGISLPGDLPGPGPFNDQLDAVRYWDRVIDSESRRTADYCTSHGDPPILRHELMVEVKLHHLVVFGCTSDSESWTYEQLANRTAARIENNSATLSNLKSFNNVTSVEMAAALMSLQLSIESDLIVHLEHNRARVAADPNQSEERGPLASLLGDSLVIEQILQHFPASGPCQEPSDDVSDDTVARLSRVQLALMSEPRLIAAGINEVHASLIEDPILPNLHEAHDRGWWPYALRPASLAPFFEEYHDIAADGLLANHEEALYLHAVNANRMRSPHYDWHLKADADLLEAHLSWEEQPDYSLQVMARAAQDWAFASISCDSSIVAAH